MVKNRTIILGVPSLQLGNQYNLYLTAFRVERTYRRLWYVSQCIITWAGSFSVPVFQILHTSRHWRILHIQSIRVSEIVSSVLSYDICTWDACFTTQASRNLLTENWNLAKKFLIHLSFFYLTSHQNPSVTVSINSPQLQHRFCSYICSSRSTVD